MEFAVLYFFLLCIQYWYIIVAGILLSSVAIFLTRPRKYSFIVHLTKPHQDLIVGQWYRVTGTVEPIKDGSSD